MALAKAPKAPTEARITAAIETVRFLRGHFGCDTEIDEVLRALDKLMSLRVAFLGRDAAVISELETSVLNGDLDARPLGGCTATAL